VDEDASNLVASLATLAGKHFEGLAAFVDGVKGCLRVPGSCRRKSFSRVLIVDVVSGEIRRYSQGP
jgi:hypothetical protein